MMMVMRFLVWVEIIFPLVLKDFYSVVWEGNLIHAVWTVDIGELGLCEPGVMAVLTGCFHSGEVFCHGLPPR